MAMRLKYFLLFIFLVGAAFFCRVVLHWLYLPDVLTAAFVYFFFRAIFPGISPATTATMTFILTVLVELSQLYQADWISGWRATSMGIFVLGHKFDAWDIVSYLFGVLMALWADRKYFIIDNQRVN